MQGIFITFEGIDGSGKTTQCRRLINYLTKEGYQCLTLREPGSTSISEQIRKILLDPENKEIAWRTETMLYAAARAQLVEEMILPSLSQGKIVICDRFLDSSIAYQGYGRGLDIEAIKTANKLAVQGLKPHLTMLLDIDPIDAVKRINLNRENKDRLESEALSFYQNIRQGYLQMANEEHERIRVVSANQTENEIHEQIVDYVLTLLNG